MTEQRPETQAEQARRTIREEWADQAAIVLKHPELGPKMRRLQRRQDRLGLVSDLATVGDATVLSVLDGIRTVARSTASAEQQARIDRTAIVMMRSETPRVTSERFEDDSYLIRMTDSTYSLYNTIGEIVVARVVADRERHRDAAIQACIAAFRFHLLAGLLWGSSITVGFRAKRADAALRMSPDAAIFATAHELGHIVLGHLSHSGPAVALHMRKQRELEADRYAASLLQSGPFSVSGRAKRVRQSIAIAVPLLFTEARDRAFFIRAPDTHPTFDQRLGALVASGAIVEESLESIDVVREVLRAASDVSAHLPAPWWDALLASDGWLTGRRPDHEYDYFRHADGLLGNPAAAHRHRLSRLRDDDGPNFTPIIDAVPGAVGAALTAVGVRKATVLSDLSQTLTRRSLLSAIATSRAWDGVEGQVGDPAIRSVTSLIVSQLIEDLWRREGGDCDDPGR